MTPSSMYSSSMPACWKRGKTSVLSARETSSGSTRLEGPRRLPRSSEVLAGRGSLRTLAGLVGPAQAAQQLVGVAGPRSLPHDLGPGTRLHEHGVPLLGQAPEQGRD